MGLNNYKELLYQRIKKELDVWEELGTVKEKDIYALLYIIKDTAETIGLRKLINLSEKKLIEIDKDSEKQWKKVEWVLFLSPVVEMYLNDQKRVKNEGDIQPHQSSRTPENELILIIDDDMSFISNMKQIFEQSGYSVIVANNGKRGINLIYQMQPALVFLNPDLSYFTGTSLLFLMEKIKKDRTFIAVVGEQSRLDAAEAYELGAMDFLQKPLSDRLALAYVKNRLSYRRELEYAIVTDELTKAYNRKYLEIEMSQLVNRYQSRKELFSVVIIDLDDFKKVNDTYGHLVGDEVLKELAAIVMEMIRPEDFFFRYGGEEFILLCPYTTSVEAYAIIERIRKKIELHAFTVNDDVFYATISQGVVTINQDFVNSSKLIEAADRALYVAKITGKNRTIIYDSSIANVKVDKKLKLIIIDDVKMIREIIKDRFEYLKRKRNLDIDIEVYTDGYYFLQSDWYDSRYRYIILLDWLLPKMDGIEVLEEIRKKYSSKEVFISMLTGRKGEESVVEALNKGADDYISKPFQVNEMAEKILHLAQRTFEK